MVLKEEYRSKLIGEGWKDISKLFVMACLLDLAFQLIVLKSIYPLETLVVAGLHAVFPYVAVGGLALRAFSRKHESSSA